MTKFKLLLAGVAAAVLVPAAASAQDMSGTTFYGTIGGSWISADDADLGAITGRLGARFMPYLGVEGEVSLGVDDDDIGPVSVGIEHQLAAYLVASAPVSPRADLFARVGFGTTSIETEAFGVSDSESETSVNFGVGGQLFFDDANGVRAEYTRFEFNDDNVDSADVFTVSYVRKFP